MIDFKSFWNLESSLSEVFKKGEITRGYSKEVLLWLGMIVKAPSNPRGQGSTNCGI
jgi:hypothetical protein